MIRWDHTGIKSADVERSIHFYCGVLGLERLETINLLGRDFHFVGNDTIRIEIEAAAPGDPQADMGRSAGLYHLALAVDDLEAVAERLRRAGVTFLLPPSQFRPDRKIAFFRDPDGVFIQLIQYLDAPSAA
jgi:catechol 2,3-dioxygenase-like lactoylglutathione lyase family enzyme